MPDHLTLTGVVATEPRHITTNSGLDITTFRLASGQRRYDRQQNRWVDAETNWYTVSTFRHLAVNVVGSIERGQHVVVTGRVRIRAWENGEKSGTTIELEAEAVGHDLSWGTAVYKKSVLAGSALADSVLPGSVGAGGRVEAPSGAFLPADSAASPGLTPSTWATPLGAEEHSAGPGASSEETDAADDVLVPF